MQNVPWHHEVVAFVDKLVAQLANYAISCEHEHSNCVLVANKKVAGFRYILDRVSFYIFFCNFQFLVDGEWNTWIDYTKFHELYRNFHENGATFTSMDYMAPTPHWAVLGSRHQGFDPQDTRWFRKTKKDLSGC